jgi:meiotically up-regulated gene 157 (Mug157) protein
MEKLTRWLADLEKDFAGRNELYGMFKQCFMNTLDTTAELLDDGTAYVFTGDIPAMWLRDSSAQVSPYLFAAKESPCVRALIRGLLKRQFRYILLDPYANAFNKEPNGRGHQTDTTKMCDWVWERKFEIDSLCYPVWLAYRYSRNTGDTSVFDEGFFRAAETVLSVFKREQRHTEESDYSFIRTGEFAADTLPNGGRGEPAPYTGMVWSAFRPSDDRCGYNYLIPANQFAVVILGYLAEIAGFSGRPDIENAAKSLRAEIDGGIRAYGIYNHPVYGRMFAYETDGKGAYTLMDDANVPSLLSLPYLGYCGANDELYQNTRRFILGGDNPYYYEGGFAKGVGSPHTPEKYIWPISLIMQGLTSNDPAEKRALLKTRTPVPFTCTRASTRTTPPPTPARGSHGRTPCSPYSCCKTKKYYPAKPAPARRKFASLRCANLAGLYMGKPAKKRGF